MNKQDAGKWQKKLFPYELIGEEAEVVDSRNKANRGIKGKITDETKMTIKISHSGKNETKIRTLMKSNIVLRLSKSGRLVSGKELAGRPEERMIK